MMRVALVLLLAAAAGAGCTRSDSAADPAAETPDCCKPAPAAAAAAGGDDDGPPEQLRLPDVTLTDQNGRAVRLTELVGRRVVAVNFLFTSCTTACPLLGGKFGEVGRLLGDRLGPDFGLVSVSVDPAVDTPDRLAEFARRYEAGPGWTLLTGAKPDVERVLKAFSAFTPDKQNHPATVVVLDGTTGRAWRVGAQGSAARIEQRMRAAAAERAARNHFTDTELVDQTGRRVRFYSDLLAGKTVVIDTFFSACAGSCVKLGTALKAIQDRHPDRMGKDLHLVSISVDPAADRPEVLREYATRLGAKPGWHFLTGDKKSIDLVLERLGQRVGVKEAHSSILLIGNDRTGLWKKANGLSDPAQLLPVFDEVLNDRGR